MKLKRIGIVSVEFQWMIRHCMNSLNAFISLMKNELKSKRERERERNRERNGCRNNTHLNTHNFFLFFEIFS